jgi:hypothetical protein
LVAISPKDIVETASSERISSSWRYCFGSTWTLTWWLHWAEGGMSGALGSLRISGSAALRKYVLRLSAARDATQNCGMKRTRASRWGWINNHSGNKSRKRRQKIAEGDKMVMEVLRDANIESKVPSMMI